MSGYVGGVNMGEDGEVGGVYKVDRVRMKVVEKVRVGYEGDELGVVDGKVYVGKSGGYGNGK